MIEMIFFKISLNIMKNYLAGNFVKKRYIENCGGTITSIALIKFLNLSINHAFHRNLETKYISGILSNIYL